MQKSSRLVVPLFLFILSVACFAGAKSLDGTYVLYAPENGKVPVTKMIISQHVGKTFQVQGERSKDQLWEGTGQFENGKGFYDWKFNDGRSGRTTFTLTKEGDLKGHVNASKDSPGLKWDFVAKKEPAKSK